MIDFDLSASKLEKDQQKRRTDAKQKITDERRKQLEKIRFEKHQAEISLIRKQEQEAAFAIKLQEEENEQKLTGGIKFSHNLKPYMIESEDDRVLLPEECLNELASQDAFGKGAVTCELRAIGMSGTLLRITHCGVREFTASPGAIGLPPKVISSLGNQLDQIHAIVIKYVVLPKCTYAKLQPLLKDFFDVQAVKHCLEENLKFHASLTTGDVITIWFRGKCHELKVVELQPDAGCSLLNTDVEIDLDVSAESNAGQQQKEHEDTSKIAPTTKPSSREPAVSPVANTMDMDTVDQQSLVENRALIALHLSPEPPTSDSNDVLHAKVKLPSGVTKVRRFSRFQSAANILLFVAGEALEDPTLNNLPLLALLARLQISTRFPPRTIRSVDFGADPVTAVSLAAWVLEASKSFDDLGFKSNTEAFFVTIGQ